MISFRTHSLPPSLSLARTSSILLLLWDVSTIPCESVVLHHSLLTQWRQPESVFFPWSLCVTLINCLRGILIKLCRDFSINHPIYALRWLFVCDASQHGNMRRYRRIGRQPFSHLCRGTNGARNTLVQCKHTCSAMTELWNCGWQTTTRDILRARLCTVHMNGSRKKEQVESRDKKIIINKWQQRQ